MGYAVKMPQIQSTVLAEIACLEIADEKKKKEDFKPKNFCLSTFPNVSACISLKSWIKKWGAGRGGDRTTIPTFTEGVHWSPAGTIYLAYT